MSGPKVRRIRFTQSVVGERINFRPHGVYDVERGMAAGFLKSGAAVAAEGEPLTVWPHTPRPPCCGSCGSENLAVDGGTEAWFCCTCQGWA
jgi:hypothetical protein